jgi:hypothetical protein
VLRKPVGGEPSDQFIGIAGALLAVVMPQRKGERLCKSFVIGKPQFSVFVWPHGCLSCPVWDTLSSKGAPLLFPLCSHRKLRESTVASQFAKLICSA